MSEDVIRVELGAEVKPGVWEYACTVHPVCGKSHQPLSDACRQLKLSPAFAYTHTPASFRSSTPSCTSMNPPWVGWTYTGTNCPFFLSQPMRELLRSAICRMMSIQSVGIVKGLRSLR